MPLEVNLVNLLDVLQKVTDVYDLGLHLGVPEHALDKIQQDFHMTDERKREMLKWWLRHTHKPTWKKLIAALRKMNLPILANAVAVVSKRESLHEPCDEDSQRWEHKVKTLKQVLERAKHLEKEWEKGEEEWRKHLKGLGKVAEGWEDLVETQQAYLTLGISLLFQSNSTPLRQCSLLDQKVQKQLQRSKELRQFYGEASQHRHKLQNAEMELRSGKSYC